MDRESTRMLLQQWTFSIHRMHRHDSIYAAPAFVCLFQQWRIEISEKYDHSVALSSDGINYMLYMFDGNEDLFTFGSCFNWNFTCHDMELIHGDRRRLRGINSFILECYISLDTTARIVNKKILWKQKLIQNSPHILVSPTRTVSECSPNICWQCWRFHVVNPIQLPQNNQLSSDNIASRSFWFPNVWWPISAEDGRCSTRIHKHFPPNPFWKSA